MNDLGTASRILLVEDNAADATLVREYLSEPAAEFRILHVSNVADAVTALGSVPIDLVLLDLRLPDSNGVETVETIRAAATRVPIVVLSGMEDERLGSNCVHRGAEDFLSKSRIKGEPLRRAVGYALTRHRESEEREMLEVHEEFRALSSEASGTSVTAALTGAGSIKERIPEVFHALVDAYLELLTRYLEQLVTTTEKPRTEMEVLTTMIGDRGGGPRDLVDIHLAALQRAGVEDDRQRARRVALDGRLMALEMMGLLVDYFRVGQRRSR